MGSFRGLVCVLTIFDFIKTVFSSKHKMTSFSVSIATTTKKRKAVMAPVDKLWYGHCYYSYDDVELTLLVRCVTKLEAEREVLRKIKARSDPLTFPQYSSTVKVLVSELVLSHNEATMLSVKPETSQTERNPTKNVYSIVAGTYVKEI